MSLKSSRYMIATSVYLLYFSYSSNFKILLTVRISFSITTTTINNREKRILSRKLVRKYGILHNEKNI